VQSKGRRREENGPRSVSALTRATHGMTVLRQIAQASLLQLHPRHHCRSEARASWSPIGTLCPKARGLSPQRIWEQTPRLCAVKPRFLCLLSRGSTSGLIKHFKRTRLETVQHWMPSSMNSPESQAKKTKASCVELLHSIPSLCTTTALT